MVLSNVLIFGIFGLIHSIHCQEIEDIENTIKSSKPFIFQGKIGTEWLIGMYSLIEIK